MGKRLKVGVILAVAVVLLAGAIIISGTGGGKIADGTYKITNSGAYPDARIVVRGNEIQFYDIDLNSLYREQERKSFEEWVKRGIGANMTEEQIEKASDLNEMFISNSWEIDYNLITSSKQGTFTHAYFCMVSDTCFGLVLQYDSLHRTIQINDADPQKVLVFKRQWGK